MHLLSFRIMMLGMAVFMAGAVVQAKEPAPVKAPARASKPAVIDSAQLERDLQALSWPQFRSVVEAVPQLRAEVEKHGSAGWLYLQAKYKTYAWKKSIERLADGDKKALAKLIAKARTGR